MLSDGQKRVQDIVCLQLNKYRHCYPFWGGNQAHIFSETLELLAADPVIVNDKITGASLQTPDVSSSYLLWLQQVSPYRYRTGGSPDVSPDKFAYSRFATGGRYTGGVKPETTVRALFSLAAEKSGIQEYESIPVHNADYCWFPRAQILTIGSGGNHRMLAHVLWGDDCLSGYDFCVYDDSLHDPELNTALLRLESLPFLNGVSFFNCLYEEDEAMKRQSLLAQARHIKQLTRRADAAILAFLWPYYRKNYQSLRLSFAEAMLQFLDEAEKFWEMGQMNYTLLKVKRLLKGLPIQTSFEEFVQKQGFGPNPLFAR